MKSICLNRLSTTGKTCKKHTVLRSLAVLLITGFMIAGCGPSNYAGNSDWQTDEDSGNKNMVLERWESTLDMANSEVTYLTTGEGPDPVPVEISGDTGLRDPVSFGISLTRNKDGKIVGNGELLIEPDRSFTGHQMYFWFNELDVELAAETLTISGSGIMKTKTKNGMAATAETSISFVLKDMTSHYECDVVFAVLDLGIIRCYFTKEVLRKTEKAVSLASDRWIKKGTAVTVHFPKKRYSDQAAVSGIAEDRLLDLQVSNNEDTPLISGRFDIPRNLSVNDDRIIIDLVDVPAYIHKTDTEIFLRSHKSGTLTTLDAEGNSVTTDYSLTVNIKAEKANVVAPGDVITGKKVKYTATVTLVSDKIGVRTTTITEINRTDIPETVVGTDEALIIPGMTGALLSTEENKTCSLTHAFSQSTTEDTVDTDPLSLEFALTVTDAISNGHIKLPQAATPEGIPALIVDFNNKETAITGDSIEIECPVLLERQHSTPYSSFVEANLLITITEQSGGDYIMEATVTSKDYETNFSFSLKVLKTDGGNSFSNSTWSTSSGETHSVAITTGSNPADYINVENNSIDMKLNFGRRIKNGDLSVKASGSLSLTHASFNSGLAFQVKYTDLTVTEADIDGKRIALEGNWALQTAQPDADISENILNIEFIETATGDRIFQITLTIPGGGITPSKTLEFTLPAKKVIGSSNIIQEITQEITEDA